jgi:hypothetical protein
MYVIQDVETRAETGLGACCNVTRVGGRREGEKGVGRRRAAKRGLGGDVKIIIFTLIGEIQNRFQFTGQL